MDSNNKKPYIVKSCLFKLIKVVRGNHCLCLVFNQIYCQFINVFLNEVKVYSSFKLQYFIFNISFLSSGYDKIPREKQLREERVDCGLVEGMYSIMVVGAWGQPGSQEVEKLHFTSVESHDDLGLDYTTPKACPDAFTSSSMALPFKGSTTPQTVLLARDQIFKHMTLWEYFILKAQKLYNVHHST